MSKAKKLVIDHVVTRKDTTELLPTHKELVLEKGMLTDEEMELVGVKLEDVIQYPKAHLKAAEADESEDEAESNDDEDSEADAEADEKPKRGRPKKGE